MKRKKTLIILGCALILLIGIIVAEKLIIRHVDKLNSTDEVILTIDPDTLSSVTWSIGEDSLEFIKEDNVWKNSEDPDFPVNQDTISELLDHFKEVYASFIINDVEDYGQYGLDNPEGSILFTGEDGETKVELGGFSTIDEKRYITLDDEIVYLIDSDPMEYISTERDDYMQHFVAPDFEIYNELIVTGKNSLDAVYDPDGTYCYTQEYSYYDVSSGEHLPLKNSTVESFLDTLTNLDLTDYASYTASAETLEDFGLSEPEQTFTVTGTLPAEDENEEDSVGESAEMTLYVGVVETEELDENDEPIDAYYARYADSEIIYNLSSSDYARLSASNYDSLRPTEVFSLDWDTVSGLTFEINGTIYETVKGILPETEQEDDDSETAENTSDSEEEIEEVFLMNNKEFKSSDIIAAIDYLKIDTFDSALETGEKELSMTILLDNEHFPSLALDIYQYDGDDCVVILDGATIGLMDRALMADLKEALISSVLENQSEGNS